MRSSVNLPGVSLAALILSFSSLAHSGTKVAFTGDQGTNDNARAVLNMIASEGVDLVLIQGDLGYDINAAKKWESNLTETLGENFPVLTGVGNHENYEWDRYHRYIKNRIDRAGGLSCSGNPGVKAHCKFNNIEIVQVSPGINEVAGVSPDDNYPEYIADKFAGTSDKWRICSWHKNMKNMQTGSKGNSTGWDVYNKCLDAGAMIAVAHEHSYSRTHLMSSFESQSVAHRNSEMTLESGRSFMFVSGLGGRSIREQKRGGDWWASIYTASQGATHGALICDFEQSTARCYFKAIDGSVPDQFTLRRDGGGSARSTNAVQSEPVSEKPMELADVPAVFKRTDSNEYRWIDRDVNGELGNVAIDSSCKDTLGGTDLSGDWDDLVTLAPGVDSIASPCESDNSNASNDVVYPPPPPPARAAGYVFARTDKDEMRWIGKTSTGEVGSIRINKTCANSFGGPTASGDWRDLSAAAPAFDQVEHPCTGQSVTVSSNQPTSTGGYLFVRTDKDEKRWISRTASGELGSIRISNACVKKLGVAPVYGDWKQLQKIAPKLDQVLNPCS